LPEVKITAELLLHWQVPVVADQTKAELKQLHEFDILLLRVK
jgi:hypothetical protein